MGTNKKSKGKNKGVKDFDMSILKSISSFTIHDETKGDVKINFPIGIYVYTSNQMTDLDTSQDIYWQLGEFYHWDKLPVGTNLISDGFYIGVKAYNTFYKLPLPIKVESNTLKDILYTLANYYNWKVTDKNDTK